MTAAFTRPGAQTGARTGRLVADFLDDLDRLDTELGRRAVVAELLTDFESADLRDRVRLRIAHLHNDLITARALAVSVGVVRADRRALRRNTVRAVLFRPRFVRHLLAQGMLTQFHRRAALRRAFFTAWGRALEQADTLNRALHRDLASVRALVLAVVTDPRREGDLAAEASFDRFRDLLRAMSTARASAHLLLLELSEDITDKQANQRVLRLALRSASRVARALAHDSTPPPITPPHGSAPQHDDWSCRAGGGSLGRGAARPGRNRSGGG